MSALIWLALLLLLAGLTLTLRKLGVLPIVTQLCAALLLPVLVFYLPDSAAQYYDNLTAGAWLKLIYASCFTLLLGCILTDIADTKLSMDSVKIALPSFVVPFVCGVICAWLFFSELEPLAILALGLLFSITAIPVLFLYLQGIGYPAADRQRLVQAAIVIDVLCWAIFALAQSSTELWQLLLPLLAGLLPVLLYQCKLRQSWLYSAIFFAMLLLLQWLAMNALLFGVVYALLVARLGLRLSIPIQAKLWYLLQWYLCVPVILIYGVLQIRLAEVQWQGAASTLLVLVIVPILSKIAGSWLGVYWVRGERSLAALWQDSVLLNIRGLTEIIFLNILLQHGLIDALLYFGLLLMSVVSTILPALLGLRQQRLALS
ncbi:MAG: sodium:proton antiporter [Pseudomonas sp.]|nr:sodium:proton antiporter [Pseudomonas sp.]